MAMLFLAPVIVIVCFVASAVFFPKHGKIPYYDTNFTTLQGTAGIDAVHRNALPHKVCLLPRTIAWDRAALGCRAL